MTDQPIEKGQRWQTRRGRVYEVTRIIAASSWTPGHPPEPLVWLLEVGGDPGDEEEVRASELREDYTLRGLHPERTIPL